MDEQTPEENYEKELKSLVTQVTETNKRLDEIYDEKMRKLVAEKRLLPTDEKAEESHKSSIQILREKLDELNSSISKARKIGKDPFIAFMLARNIPPKIKMAEVTREKKDFDLANDLIETAREELRAAEQENIIDVRKEIEAKLLVEKGKP